MPHDTICSTSNATSSSFNLTILINICKDDSDDRKLFLNSDNPTLNSTRVIVGAAGARLMKIQCSNSTRGFKSARIRGLLKKFRGSAGPNSNQSFFALTTVRSS